MPAAVIRFSFSQLHRRCSQTLLKLTKMLTRVGRLNLAYTILICLNHFAYGITTNLIGATLVDLRFIFGVSLNVIAYLPVATGLGYLIGSLASYTYGGRLNRQLALIGYVLLMAVTMALLPRYGHLGVALPALVLSGIGSGAWDAATSLWLVELWPVGNSALLQGSQFAWGAGSIVAPMAVSPFVYGEANVTADNRTLTVEERVERLAIPYQIVGGVQVIVPIALFILFFVSRYQKPTAVRLKNEESDEEEEEEEEGEEGTEDLEGHSIQDSQEDRIHYQQRKEIPNRQAKLLLCGLVLATYGTVEIGHFSFSGALFQQLPVQLSAASSAHLLGILSATYALGRLASAFISLRLQPDTILWYHFVLLFASLGALFLGRNQTGLITGATAVLGYAFSAFWPAVFALAERHLRLTDGVCSLFSFLSGGVSLVIPLVLGWTFRSWPLVLFYLEFAFLGVSLALYVWLKVWIAADDSLVVRRRRSRRRRKRNSVGESEVLVAGNAAGGDEVHSHIY